ncbi:MIS18 kinetochore protein A [Pitangus sulphuratus]|nr:MIS18 kinetochore protein A [Pitangus sulphuratus]
MAGALFPPPELAAELERSMSLLDVDAGGSAEQQQQQQQQQPWEAGAEGSFSAELLPMVFLCAGCKRPVGDTLSWVSNDEEGGCILLRSAAAGVSVDHKRKLSKLPDECGCYILGSSEKQALTDEEPLTLESRAVLQEVLQRAHTILKALETRLTAIESCVTPLPKKV